MCVHHAIWVWLVLYHVWPWPGIVSSHLEFEAKRQRMFTGCDVRAVVGGGGGDRATEGVLWGACVRERGNVATYSHVKVKLQLCVFLDEVFMRDREHHQPIGHARVHQVIRCRDVRR